MRGSFAQTFRNCQAASETILEARELPCPETGVERRQIITDVSKAMIG